MINTINNLFSILSSRRLTLSDEKVLQGEIENLMNENGIIHEREKHLGELGIIDFFLDCGVGVEIKIGGAPKRIYDQLARYCSDSSISSIVLISNKSMGLPAEINGKPAYMLNLGRSWL